MARPTGQVSAASSPGQVPGFAGGLTTSDETTTGAAGSSSETRKAAQETMDRSVETSGRAMTTSAPRAARAVVDACAPAGSSEMGIDEVGGT